MTPWPGELTETPGYQLIPYHSTSTVSVLLKDILCLQTMQRLQNTAAALLLQEEISSLGGKVYITDLCYQSILVLTQMTNSQEQCAG